MANKHKQKQKPKKLTAKQKKFCEEYLVDLNATQAAKRAGYSPKTAFSIAVENLKKPLIAQYIQERQSELAKKTNISQEFIINNLKEVSERCLQHTPVFDKDGNPIGEYKFDAAGANRAIEMLAKHIGFFEADNKVEHSGTVQIVNFRDVE